MSQPTSPRMPTLFVGHGTPMNALEDNRWSRGFTRLGQSLPRPTAVLAVSAHWYVQGTWLTADRHPRTVHDFVGFPRALYEVRYPAPGNPELAEQIARRLASHEPGLSTTWGLDHGTWSVLRWMFPEADLPVLQLSLDRGLAPREHLALARRLGSLRDQGVLLLASGNLVHNLGDAFGRMQTGRTDTPPWAARFDRAVKERLSQRDEAGLLSLWTDGADARVAHPTPEHFLPLLYAQAASENGDEVRFPIEGFDLGSLSMTAVRFG